MKDPPTLTRLLERYIDDVERHGVGRAAEELAAEEPELVDALREHIRRYHEIEETLSFDASAPSAPAAAADAPALPTFDGFRTVERLGAGGMGEVYKLEDLRLGRTVAAKILRRSSALSESYGDFLREARSLALFQGEAGTAAASGIVRIYEYRADSDPPVILMEYVDGFELDRIGPSLEYAQRARLVAEVCEALEGAHAVGIQHRDLKPNNILVTADLHPKIVDFGLSTGDPRRGHGVGTLGYVAPEQLDPERDLDARTDVYALGVVLYELLCTQPPYSGEVPEVIDAIRGGQPRLPKEVEPTVPEPLQAIALKAMERDPSQRYASAREMARDLHRFLDDRPVLARPTLYASALERRMRPHLEHLREWLSLKLIYPHEARSLADAYRRLAAREEDWIVGSRRLSLSQISLYLGAFLLLCGGLFYFSAHRFFEAIEGLLGPLVVLGIPVAGLHAAGFLLDRRQRKAVAVAFHLAGALLGPLLLILVLHELGLWVESAEPFFEGVSNRQLQVATLAACGWTFFLALRTRTMALSTAFTVYGVLAALAIHTDLGLREWIEEERWDLLALHLTPLLLVDAGLGLGMDRFRRAWLATPLYLGGALLLVVILELLALDGRAFAYLGLSMDRFQPAEIDDPTLLDTLAAMTINGLVFYGAGSLVDRFGSEVAQKAARLLFALSPFAVLEPLFHLTQTEDYAVGFHWTYLAVALAITFLSHIRQRKSFYYAGIVNTGMALFLIASRYQWFDVPNWSIAVIIAGLVVLLAGVGLDGYERLRRREF